MDLLQFLTDGSVYIYIVEPASPCNSLLEARNAAHSEVHFNVFTLHLNSQQLECEREGQKWMKDGDIFIYIAQFALKALI